MSEKMDRKRARKIVNKIVADLTDRRGLKHEWYQIDDDTMKEIIKTWTDIVQGGAV